MMYVEMQHTLNTKEGTKRKNYPKVYIWNEISWFALLTATLWIGAQLLVREFWHLSASLRVQWQETTQHQEKGPVSAVFLHLCVSDS